MRRRMTKVMVMMFGMSLALSMVGCSSSKKADNSTDVKKEAKSKEETKKEVSLKVGDTYEFKGLPKGTKDTPLKFVSKDATVAEVKQGKYIVAHNAGDTTVTVTAGSDTYTYKVSVTSDQDRLLEVPDVRDRTVYVGAGYNALDCKQYPALNDINVSRSIITPTIVNKFRASFKKYLEQLVEEEELDENILKKDDLILMDGSNVESVLKVQTQKESSYGDEYERIIEGELNVKIQDIINGKAKLNMHKKESEDKSKTYVFNSIIAMNQRYKFMFNATSEYLTAMAQSNTSAWKKLTSTKVDPERVFKLYGTHIITDALIGGRAQLNYVMSMDKSKTSSSEMIKVGGNIGVKVSTVDVSGSGDYKDEKTKKMIEDGLDINSEAKTYGGKSSTGKLITELDSFADNYGTWYKSLNESTVTFIGVTQTGLLPIWELLPEEDEYEARRNQLKNAYYKLMNQPVPETNYTIENTNESAKKIFNAVKKDANK